MGGCSWLEEEEKDLERNRQINRDKRDKVRCTARRDSALQSQKHIGVTLSTASTRALPASSKRTICALLGCDTAHAAAIRAVHPVCDNEEEEEKKKKEKKKKKTPRDGQDPGIICCTVWGEWLEEIG